MNYQKVYNSIITHRRLNPYNGYTERHHIIPRSLGGEDHPVNLVNLTAREHFICHYLLIKINKDNPVFFRKMLKAFNMMQVNSLNQNRYTPSRIYDYYRTEFSKTQSICQSGSSNSQYNTMPIHNLSLQKNTRINKDSTIPEGWQKGFIPCFKMHALKQQIDDMIKNHTISTFIPPDDLYLSKALRQKIRIAIRRDLIRQSYDLKQSDKTLVQYKSSTNWPYIAHEYYEIYNTHGFKKLKELTGYNKSQPNLIRIFIKYVPEYKPQNGKKRGI